MSTTTSAAKPAVRNKPTDRQPSKAALARDAQLAEDEQLKDLPPMKDPTALRFRDRSKILILSARLEDLADDDGKVEIDPKDFEVMAKYLDLVSDFADIARDHLAIDVDAWDRWETKADWGQIGALLGRYGRAVGESSGSSN